MKKAVVLALLATFVAIPAAAEKLFHLVASETLSYDDNIYLTDKNKKDSFISTTRIGADYQANIPSTGLKLAADAGVGYNAYNEDHNKNNYWDALGGFRLSNDQFQIGDRVIYTSDPANSSIDERHKRLNNTGYFSYVTSHEKMFGLGILASDSYDRYFQSSMQTLNRNRLNLGAQLFYNMSAKTHFFAEYIYSDIDYQKTKGKVKNSHSHALGVGVEGQIAPKIEGTAKITYDMRKYERDLENVDSYNDLLGYYVALTWKPSTRNVIRLSGERKMEETFYYDNRYFADTIVSLYGSHKLTDKFTAALTLGWENMDYPKTDHNIKRDDNLYFVRPEFTYQFKEWLSAGIWYQFRTRHSNDYRNGGTGERYNYNSNKAGVFVKAVF